jgi:transcriptional regulator with PAS, ATPase and Fis domain
LERLAPAEKTRVDAAPLETHPRDDERDDQRDEDTTALPLRVAARRFPSIVGKSRALEQALGRLDAAIDGDLPVLVVGESGTGKELFARALHEHGRRARGPFVAVNCAAISDALFEAELFGHARGAFTGADRARVGLMTRAEGGTLFFDEIGELSAARQATLLRALETRRVRPVGSDDERDVDVRFVAATNRDLEAAVAKGAFRRDLFYRLNVVEIRVPALRDRPEDIALLARHVLSSAGSRAEIAPGAMACIEGYDWPGNVRELEHLMQRLAATGALRIERAHLPRELRRAVQAETRSSGAREASRAPDPRVEVERALRSAGGNITHAARALGLTRHGLKKRMLRLGLRVPRSARA